VTDQKAIEYLESFPFTPKADLSLKYPGAPKESIDFLNKILVFNPYFRMSLTDALSHPLFDNVRRPQAESFVGKPIELEIEKMNLDKKTLREMFLKEIY
jgi:mitogen-activated protein kinase 1/3